MPAKSIAQQRFMGMCSHSPQHARGKCPGKEVAREFAQTAHKGLPYKRGWMRPKRKSR